MAFLQPANKPPTLLLGLLTALDAMAIDSYMPAIPSIQAGLSATAAQVQQSFSAFLGGIVVGQLLWGPISDHFGRRWPLFSGLALYVGGSLLAITATGPGEFLIARLVQAFGASAGLVIVRAVVSDVYEPAAAAGIYTLLMQILGATALVSPLIGGAMLAYSGWRSIFGLLLLVGITCVIACARHLPESLPPERRERASPGEIVRAYRTLLTNRAYLGAALAGAFTMAAMFALLAGSSLFFIGQMGWSVAQYSVMYSATALVFVGACQCNVAALRRWSTAMVCGVGLAAQFFVAAAFAVVVYSGAGGAGSFVIAMTALLALIGFVIGNAVAVSMAEADDHAGIASGLVGVLQFLASALIAPLVARGTSGASHSTSLTLVACAAAAVLFWFWRTNEPQIDKCHA